MERSIAFYADILGLELLRGGDRLAFFRSGKDHVVLAKTDVPPSAAAVRNVHHAFIVESRDFDESLAFLRSSNVEVVFEEERSGDSVFAGRSAYFHDPDGNVLEIIDLAATAFRPRPKAAHAIA
jgi:catechol 2,3-dioxygenase-like lactoylglutathione lyase family enzyme